MLPTRSAKIKKGEKHQKLKIAAEKIKTAEAKLAKAKEIETKDEEIEELKKRLEEATKEEKDIDAMEIDSGEPEPAIKEENTENPSIIPSSENTDGTKGNPIDLHGDSADIFAADTQAKVSAEGGERKVLAYKTGLRGVIQALVQYGPDNCAKYRLELASKQDLVRYPGLNISDPQTRKGEKHSFETGSKVYQYGKDDVKAIQGVFLPSGRLNPLDAVDPALKDKRFEPIMVRLSWKEQAGGGYSFETRTTFKRLWRATTGHEKDARCRYMF